MNVLTYYSIYYPIDYYDDHLPDGINYLHSIQQVNGQHFDRIPIYGANAEETMKIPHREIVDAIVSLWHPLYRTHAVMKVGYVDPHEATFKPWINRGVEAR